VIGAHQQAARRLAALTQPEREWVLARLAAADALRIRELMEPASAPVPEPAPEPVATAPAPQSDEQILEHATPDEVLRLLQDEPDWFIALVLARRRWPWDREVLASLDPARFEELGMLAWRAGEGAKARACEAAVGLLAAKLRERAAPPAAGSAFDELLARMS
jgi:hypothetical protein